MFRKVNLADRDTAGTLQIRDIPGAENAKRALEIASVGGHRIAISGDTEADKLLASYLIRAWEREVPGAVIVQPGAGQVITVEVYDTDRAIRDSYFGEDGGAILARVEAARGRIVEDYIDRAGMDLLDEAKRRMPLINQRVDTLVEVAKTLARMAGEARVRRLFIAEALSYVWLDAERALVAS